MIETAVATEDLGLAEKNKSKRKNKKHCRVVSKLTAKSLCIKPWILWRDAYFYVYLHKFKTNIQPMYLE